MTKYIFNIILLSMILSSCSNFLTWHLDKGIHKVTSQKSTSTVESDNIKRSYNVSSLEVWSTSTNSGIHGNTGYLKTHKKNLFAKRYQDVIATTLESTTPQELLAKKLKINKKI